MREFAAVVLTVSLVGCGSEGSREPAEGPVEVVARTAERSFELPAAPSRPAEDVILITIDTLRADALGFMGNASVATPTLDRLSAGGWTYDNARAHNVVTLPSHANILTGLLPFEHGVRDNTGFILPVSVPTAGTLLREAGFATGAFVGAFPLDRRFGLAHGFEVYDDDYAAGTRQAQMVMPERGGDVVVGRAVDWWSAQAERRRFLWLHLYDPHAPYLPPEPFRSRHPASPYHGEVEAVDHYLATLLEPLLAGTDRPTLVVFTADHGEALGEHGETSHGLFAYEATLRTPLVLWGDGIAPGRSDYPAGHVDILPTLLAATGVEAPVGLSGRSLFAASNEPMPPQYFEALTSTFTSGFAPLRGVVEEGFKFISLPIPELYDVENDPAENDNRVETDRERVRRLVRLLPVESSWPPERGQVSAETAAQLRSLGYLGGSEEVKESYGPEDDPKRWVGLDRKLHEVIDASRRGDPALAERLTREVIAERPSMSLAWFSLAQQVLDRGAPLEAIELMREAEGVGAAQGALRRQLGLTLAEVGRHAEALSVFEHFGETDDPEVLGALGLVLSEAGRQAEARDVLRRLLAADPRSAVGLERLAVVELRSERWAEARDHAEAAVSIDPGLGDSWNYLGTARYNTGDPRGAVEAWQRAIVAQPDNFDAMFNLALVAGQIGDAGLARRALERFVAGAPVDRYGPDIQRARALLRELPSGS